MKKTVKNSAVKNVKKANNNTTHNIISTTDVVVENGINYGNPNIKQMATITVYENNDYITEKFFYIGGYKFRMDDITTHSIKRYLMREIPTYRNEKELDKVLSEKVNFKMGGDAPQYIKIRMKQLTTLIRGLIKALQTSTALKDDLNKIFGTNQWDNILTADDFNGEIICNWKTEWKRDYSTAKYRL